MTVDTATNVTIDGQPYTAKRAIIGANTLGHTLVRDYWYISGPRGGNYTLLRFENGTYRFFAALSMRELSERPRVRWEDE